MQPEVAFVPTNQLRNVGWSETDLLQTNQLCRIVRAASRPTYDVAGMFLRLLTKQLRPIGGSHIICVQTNQLYCQLSLDPNSSCHRGAAGTYASSEIV